MSDPTVPGPVVRLSTLERWQKRMVDVDHLGETLKEITAQHLHVFGQHRKFNLVLFKQKTAYEIRLSLVGSEMCIRDRADAEQQILELLEENEVELAVLAKYMQVLSSDFLERFPQVINIHHSFLPAFKGAQPYHRAWDRGVKLIGATAHYVTEDLDDGPIIEQTTVAVSHRDEVEDLIRNCLLYTSPSPRD